MATEDTSPKDSMKVGILACGTIAQKMATTLTGIVDEGGHDIIPYACASRDLAKAEEFAKKNGIKKAYGSYEEMAADPEVDLIYVASPHSHHYEHMKLCIEHGKNVICEKPFTVNKKQADEIMKLAEDRGVLVTEAIWPRYMPLVKQLKEIIASNVIGDITSVTANLYYSIDMNQRIYDPALAGGALLDVGIYSLTFASVCLGDAVKSLDVSYEKFDTGVDKQSLVVLHYPNDVMAMCSSGTGAISDRKGIIYGRKGFIIVENINSPESIRVYNENYEMTAEYIAPEWITGFEYEVYACQEAIENHETECKDCTHQQISSMMGLMDEARAKMDIVYPFE